MKRIGLCLVVCLLLLGSAMSFAADEVTLPIPKSTEVLLESPHLIISQVVCESGEIITVVVYRGKEAAHMAKELGGTAFYLAEKNLLIIFDISVDI
jgi:hypothetical protein